MYPVNRRARVPLRISLKRQGDRSNAGVLGSAMIP